MTQGFIKSLEYNGSVITVEVRLNGGTYTDPVTGVTEPTFLIYSEVDGLTAVTPFSAGASGDTITDASIDDLWISYFTIAGGDPIYTHDTDGNPQFVKTSDGDTIQLLNGNTVTMGDTIAAFYLPDGSVPSFPDIRKVDLAATVTSVIDAMKAQVDSVTAPSEIVQIMLALGFTTV